jgi:hypothetical protein
LTQQIDGVLHLIAAGQDVKQCVRGEWRVAPPGDDVGDGSPRSIQVHRYGIGNELLW